MHFYTVSKKLIVYRHQKDNFISPLKKLILYRGAKLPEAILFNHRTLNEYYSLTNTEYCSNIECFIMVTNIVILPQHIKKNTKNRTLQPKEKNITNTR